MKHPRAKPPSPSKDELVAFIAEQGGKAGVREIARAFGMKNADRATLRHMLRELAEEGRVERRQKKLHRPGTLPDVVLADVCARDADGELIAVPTEGDEAGPGPAPKIHVRTTRRARPSELAGVGDRALLRVDQSAADGHYSARVIKLIDRARQRVLGIYRTSPGGGGRVIPVDKKQLGQELLIPAGAGAEAQDGDLVAAEVTEPRRGYGLPTARIKERLGSLGTERAVSLIAIHTHGIPYVFPAPALAEGQTPKPARRAGREDWRNLPLVTIDPADAKDHDDAVHAARDTAPDNRGGFIISVAIADVAHYVLPGSALDREALVGGNSVYFPDRVVPMLPERISNDLCSLRPDEDRPALAVRMTIGKDGRKRKHTFHRIMMRSHAKLSYEQAQRAIDGAPDEATAPLLETTLQPIYAAYAAMKIERAQRSPLHLDLPERKLVLNADGSLK